VAGIADILADQARDEVKKLAAKARKEIKREIVGAMIVTLVIGYFLGGGGRRR